MKMIIIEKPAKFKKDFCKAEKKPIVVKWQN